MRIGPGFPSLQFLISHDPAGEDSGSFVKKILYPHSSESLDHALKMHPSPSPTLEIGEELHSWEPREPPRQVGGSRPWQQIPANAARHRAELPAFYRGAWAAVRVKYSSVDTLIPVDGPGAGVDCRAAQVYILGVMTAQWKRMVCGCLGLSSPGSILEFCQLCP